MVGTKKFKKTQRHGYQSGRKMRCSCCLVGRPQPKRSFQLSDTSFYARVDKDLSFINQNIVKNTMNDLIAKQELPATAKILTITTPRTSCIYFLPKIHKPNNPGRPIVSACSCPTELITSSYRSDARSYEHYWTSRSNKAWKKFRPVQDLNPWPLRYRCSALQNELTRQLEAGRYFVSK